MKKWVFVLVYLFHTIIYGQNLVQNGDFEDCTLQDTLYYPYMSSSLLRHHTKVWDRVFFPPSIVNVKKKVYPGWASFLMKSIHLKAYRNYGFLVFQDDFYNFDTIERKIILPRTPEGYNYVLIDHGFYQKLIRPLQKDSFYVVSYRYKMGEDRDADSFGWDYRVVFTHYGIMFTVDTPPSLFPRLRRAPIPNYKRELQDTVFDTSYRWRLVEHIFKADSNYNYINFARFTDAIESNYTLPPSLASGPRARIHMHTLNQIDDIRLLSLDTYLRISKDTNICKGDSVELKVYGGIGDYKWINVDDPNVILSTNKTLKIIVDSTTMFQLMSPYDTASVMVYVNCPIRRELNIQSCKNFVFRDSIFKKSGLYYYTIKARTDTIYNINLNINETAYDTIKKDICHSYFYRDSVYYRSGKYKRVFTNSNQCDTIITLDLKIGIDNRVKLTDGINYTALQDSVFYQWYYCYPWRKITNGNNQTFSTNTKGSYAVILDNGKGCKDTSDCIALYSSSISSINNPVVIISPNPTKNRISIKGINTNIIEARLFDMYGRSLDISFNRESDKIVANLENLAQGVYSLLITNNENNSKFYTIIKE
jgi:hypothetical protein